MELKRLSGLRYSKSLMLSSGGLIVNYRCPAACGHCMYGCSPNAEPGYMTEEDAKDICMQLSAYGCRGLHIGGGEPFLHVDGLVAVLRAIRESGINLDYIETNAAWITGDRNRDRQTLNRVVRSGGDYIMVSADPFHVTFIPFWKTKALISLLREQGVSHFIWQERYLPMLARLDPQKTYDREALQAALGYDAQARCASEYGLGFNGRALNLIRSVAQKQRAETWLRATPCSSLTRKSHYHVDLLGRYIPPGCTGMGVVLTDLPLALGELDTLSAASISGASGVSNPSTNKNNESDASTLSDVSYSVLRRLYAGGTQGLWVYASSRGFTPSSEGYVSECDLCFAMRKYLVLQAPEAHPDLTPASFYQQDF